MVPHLHSQFLGILVILRHLDNNDNDDNDDDDDQHRNAQADPLLPASSFCLEDGAIELGIGTSHVGVDLLALLLDLRNGWLLLNDERFEVLEELRKLHHLLLDLLDILVSASDVLCHALRLAAAVRLDELEKCKFTSDFRELCRTHCLAEDLLVGCVLDSFPDFSITGVRSYDAVLSLDLFLCSPSEVSFYLLGLVDGCLQSPIDLANLWCISRIPRLLVLLDGLDTVDEAPIRSHDVLAQSVDFSTKRRFAGCIGVC